MPVENGVGAFRRVAPETAALRALQAAEAEASQALGRRMRMHPSDLAAMNHVSVSPSRLGPSELAGRLGLSAAATTELVDRLEHAGHLVRERDDLDRRRVRLIPSDTARTEVMGRLGPLLEALDGVAEGFTDAEREVVLRYLERAAAAYHRFAVEEPSAG